MAEKSQVEAAIKGLTEATKRLMALHKKMTAGKKLSPSEAAEMTDLVSVSAGMGGMVDLPASTDVLCKIFGVTSRTVYSWKKSGMPVALGAAVQWIVSQTKSGKAGAELRRKIERVRLRRQSAEARMAEIEVQRQQGELISRPLVEAQQEAKVKAVRQALDNLPRDLRGMVGRELPDLATWLDERISDICNRFAEEGETRNVKL